MRVKLPESARERKRSFGGTAVSTLVHAMLIGGTLVATGVTAEQAAQPPEPERLVWVAPDRTPPDDPPPPETKRPPVPTNLDPAPALPDTPLLDLSIVPTELSPPNTVIGTVREEEFRAAPRDSTPAGVAAPPSGEPFTEFMVERVVRSREGNPSPRYPAMLASAGVEGLVYSQFVVDTTGRVEPASIRFIKSDHALFERAVRDVLLRSRFVPAEAGNQRVRQLVEQAFSFALRR